MGDARELGSGAAQGVLLEGRRGGQRWLLRCNCVECVTASPHRSGCSAQGGGVLPVRVAVAASVVTVEHARLEAQLCCTVPGGWWQPDQHMCTAVVAMCSSRCAHTALHAFHVSGHASLQLKELSKSQKTKKRRPAFRVQYMYTAFNVGLHWDVRLGRRSQHSKRN